MAQQTINLGTVANDGTGSNLRAGGDIINDNFDELYVLTDRSASAGVVTFDGFTSVSTTTFDTGIIVAEFLDFADPSNPQATTVTRAKTFADTDPNLATSNISYVCMDSSGVLAFLTEPPTPMYLASDNVFIGQLGHPDRATITTLFSFANTMQNPMSQVRELFWGLAPIVKSGLRFSATATGMTFQRSEGYVVDLGIGSKGNEPFSETPNTSLLPAIDPVNSFLYVASDGSNIAATVVDPTQYDPNGDITNLVTVSANKFTIQYIVVFKGGFTNVQYGQTEYSTIQECRDAFLLNENDMFTVAPVIEEAALIRCALAIKQNVTGDLSAAVTAETAQFLNYGKFGRDL